MSVITNSQESLYQNTFSSAKHLQPVIRMQILPIRTMEEGLFQIYSVHLLDAAFHPFGSTSRDWFKDLLCMAFQWCVFLFYGFSN